MCIITKVCGYWTHIEACIDCSHYISFHFISFYLPANMKKHKNVLKNCTSKINNALTNFMKSDSVIRFIFTARLAYCFPLSKLW